MNNKKKSKANKTAEDYDKILKYSPFEIINNKDFALISNTISDYFKNNTKTSECGFKIILTTPNQEKTILKLNHHIAFGIKLKDFSGSTISSKIKRVKDSSHVLKKIRESFEIYNEVYFFSKSKDTYITDFALKKFEEKMLYRDSFLKNSIYISDTGRFHSAKSLATNEKEKAKEFHATCKQLEEIAVRTNKYWLAITITCPPVFHIKPVSQNYCWDGVLTPKNANEFQNKIWDDTLRQLSKKNITPIGHWVKEVNKSSAIHRHALLYGSLTEIEEIKRWLSHYTKSAYTKFKSKFTYGKSIHFDAGHCSDKHATGSKKSSVISNYLNKNLLFCLNSEECHSSINKQKIDAKTVKKAKAHADKFRYRRFGFIGLKNKLTLWKHLKYFSKKYETITNSKLPSELKNLIEFAKENNLQKFISSPFSSELNFTYQCMYDRLVNHKKKFGGNNKEIVGIKFKGVNYFKKERYFSFIEQAFKVIKLKLFLTIKNY